MWIITNDLNDTKHVINSNNYEFCKSNKDSFCWVCCVYDPENAFKISENEYLRIIKILKPV